MSSRGILKFPKILFPEIRLYTNPGLCRADTVKINLCSVYNFCLKMVLIIQKRWYKVGLSNPSLVIVFTYTDELLTILNRY